MYHRRCNFLSQKNSTYRNVKGYRFDHHRILELNVKSEINKNLQVWGWLEIFQEHAATFGVAYFPNLNTPPLRLCVFFLCVSAIISYANHDPSACREHSGGTLLLELYGRIHRIFFPLKCRSINSFFCRSFFSFNNTTQSKYLSGQTKSSLVCIWFKKEEMPVWWQVPTGYRLDNKKF